MDQEEPRDVQQQVEKTGKRARLAEKIKDNTDIPNETFVLRAAPFSRKHPTDAASSCLFRSATRAVLALICLSTSVQGPDLHRTQWQQAVRPDLYRENDLIDSPFSFCAQWPYHYRRSSHGLLPLWVSPRNTKSSPYREESTC